MDAVDAEGPVEGDPADASSNRARKQAIVRETGKSQSCTQKSNRAVFRIEPVCSVVKVVFMV